MVQDVLKGRCGIKGSSTDKESAESAVQVFARSPKKSLGKCSREIGLEKSNVHRFCELKIDISLATT